MVRWSLPLLVAAVDPVQEARLSGLDRAVVSGRFLRPDDRPRQHPPDGFTLPVLVSSRTGMDSTISLQVTRLGPAGVKALMAGARPKQLARLTGPVVTTQHYDAQALLQMLDVRGAAFNWVTSVWKPGAVVYRTGPGTRLTPAVVDNRVTFREAVDASLNPPFDNADTQFRRLELFDAGPPNGIFPRAVGVFDPGRLAGFDSAAEQPLGAFFSTRMVGANPASDRVLSGQPLLPNANMGGYQTQPPQLITTFAGIRHLVATGVLGDEAAGKPISAIRVRVAGVTGPDAVSRERIRTVAEAITKQTGLTVDIVAGSSPSPRQITLPAGRFGRPQLELREGWIRKGVALTILSALDRKSLALFILILAVCCLFAANATSAAVRSRRTELGILSCLGWPGARLFALLVMEVAATGLAAGIAGSTLALAAGHLLGVQVSPIRAALAVPAAVLVAVAAGLSPAWRAARSQPADAIRPIITTTRRAHHPRSITGLAVINVLRAKGRSLLGAASLAIGVAALTILLAVTTAFNGAIVGSLMGDAVSIQVRTVDYIATATTVILGALAIADVIYVNIRERAPEYASLQAAGWTDTHLSRAILTEGAIIGAVGATTGAALGLAGAALLAGSLPLKLIILSVVTALAATLLATAAAILPALMLARQPTAQVLTET